MLDPSAGSLEAATTAARLQSKLNGAGADASATANAVSASSGTKPGPDDGKAAAAVAGDPQQGPKDGAGAGQTSAKGSGDGIGGISTLRGVLVYAAVLTFAALYIKFIVVISDSKPNVMPHIDAALISAAAALAGILGSAFALRVGNPASQTFTNQALAQHLDEAAAGDATKRTRVAAWIHQALSLEASAADAKSWPVTFGMWVYALVASAMAITYIFNQNETPGTVKALAVTFAGYVIALLSHVFAIQTSTPSQPQPNQPQQQQ